MTQKLTLSLDKDVIERAKYLAKHTQKSVSQIVENYLDKITKESDLNFNNSSSLLKLAGSIKIPQNVDLEEERRKYFEAKHL
jgi:hypothetical protein